MRLPLNFFDPDTGDLIRCSVLWDGERLSLGPMVRETTEPTPCKVCGDVQPGGICRLARRCQGCPTRRERLRQVIHAAESG